MEVLNLDQARHFLREKPIRVNVIDRPRLTCELVCMEPGQKEERQSFDVSDNLYVVVEGTCIVRTGASEHELGVHDALVVPPGVEHWLTNPGPERVTIMAFVAPKPARASEVRFPRQQRDFSRPRPAFRPRAVAEPDEAEAVNDDEAEVQALLAELDEEEETPQPDRPPRERPAAPRPEFSRDRRDFSGRAGGGRREFSGGHESRGPRRGAAPRAYGDRGPQRGPEQGERRGFGDRPPFPSRGPRPFGNRPPPRRSFDSEVSEERGPQRGGPARGERTSFPSRGPRPFGNRPQPRRSFDNEGGEERGARRGSVSRDFYPKKPNQTGGSKEFTPRPSGRGGGPTNRGGRPAGPPRGGGRPGGGSGRSSRPNPGRSGRPAPGRNGPRTSGRRPAP